MEVRNRTSKTSIRVKQMEERSPMRLIDPAHERRGLDIFSWGTLLLRQGDRISECATSNLDSDAVAQNTFRNAVKVYARLLQGEKQLDDEFKRKAEEIKHKSDPSDQISTLDEWFDYLGLLFEYTKKTKYMPRRSGRIEDVPEDNNSVVA